MTKPTARRVAYQALTRIQRSKSFSNLMIDPLLEESGLKGQDRDFAAQLFWGVLETRVTLDFVLKRYCNRPLDRLDRSVLTVLRMGLYELYYLNTSDFAAVNEAVSLIKSVGKRSAAGFINAVLRQFVRDHKEISFPDQKTDLAGFLSIRYACPKPLTSHLLADYGAQMTEAFLSSQLGKPPLTVRVNTTKTTDDALISRLSEEGVTAKPQPLSHCLILHGKRVFATASFEQGLFHVQDAASQLCAQVAVSFAPKTVLDVCAAPGGKAFTIAQQTGAQVIACDLHTSRVRLIEEGARRLGLSGIQTIASDARTLCLRQQVDLVLCDVPCSGFGVIRRKPEIKEKSPKEVAGLPRVQFEIVTACARHLRPGGILLYATCTLNRAENERVVERFLEENRSFVPQPLPKWVQQFAPSATFCATLFPMVLNCDGFFLAALRKERER